MAHKDFHHPFQPYEIQQQFMEAMYQCIEKGKVGIFESPTGTGKSLSLICSSLTWLREHKRKTFDEALAAIEVDDDEPDWMVEHARESRKREMRQMRDELEARLKAARQKELKVRERNSQGAPALKKRKIAANDERSPSDEDQFVLDDYESDREERKPGKETSVYSTETTKLMEKLGMVQQKSRDGDVAEDVDELKIYFCSRTHSQLSQFAGELQRVKLPPGMPPETSDEPGSAKFVVEELKQLTLGSRKNLCINPKVAKLSSQTALNERCIELQQSSTPAEHKCPFLPNKDNEDLVLDFRDLALAKIRDIEDLAAVGARLGVCPYYASRPAIGPAEIVTLPYPLLLQKSAREALGISLEGHVVVIDEAHNLMNAIEGIYSMQIAEWQLKRARESMIIYLQKFRNRLKGSNRVYVTQVVRVMDSILAFFAGLNSTSGSGGTLEPGQLLAGKAADQINLAKLVRYINDSKLARKVEGYVSYAAQGQNGDGKTMARKPEPEVPTLTHVENFLMALMNPSKEGRFFWARDGDSLLVKYMLLDPSEHFREIVNDARAVILAGGTMSPMDDYRQQLFPYLPDLTTFSCGHLIPPSSLLVRAISADETGTLDFTYKSRTSEVALRIGNALRKIAPFVRGGLVVFLPSYSFLDQIADTWRKDRSMERHLGAIKPVFWDSRTGAAEDTFRAYTEAIRKGAKGAILISVLGGKLSEGINFSDDLGRCVVVIGLPFPNLDTPEWKAKLQYLDEKAAVRGEPKGKASKEHAENVCMRAVNQAVGRVIRHKDDWASIILMDSRYTQRRVRDKLPGWIKESFPAEASSRLRDVVDSVDHFFGGRTR